MNSPVNLSFVKKFNPVKVTFIGILLWVFIFFFSAIKVKQQPGILPIIFILVNYIFFFFGLISVRRRDTIINKKFVLNKRALKKILIFLIIISLIGFTFRILDKFFIRDITIGNTSVANRRLLSENKSSIFGVIAAILTPFAFLPLYIYYTLKPQKPFLAIFCIILFFIPAFDSVVLGSRSGLFMVVFLFIINLLYFKILKITPLRMMFFTVLIYILGIYTTKMFIERTQEYMVTEKRATKHILSNAVYNFTLEPKENARNGIIETKNETLRLTRLSLLNASQYYTHGVFELGYLYNNYKGEHHYGAYTFNVIAKFSNIIFGTNIDLQKIQESPVRTGVYTTFFGPIYLDFGWFAPIFMLFFGLLQGLIFNKVISGDYKYVPLFFYMLIIDFFMPVINFITSSQGVYIIVSMIVFAKSYKLLTARLIIKDDNGNKKFYKILK